MEHVPTKTEAQEGIKRYLYHMIPVDMQGTVLHPLNTLKDIHPDLYLAKANKYNNRRHIMDQFIPTLEASWNDVLHLSAIDPAELKKALIEAGMEPKEMRFYQINPELLDPKQTTVYLYSNKTGDEKMSIENFTDFDPKKLHEHAELPQVTKEYYKKMFEKGGKPLLFIGVPHILHKGSIDISNLPVVTV